MAGVHGSNHGFKIPLSRAAEVPHHVVFHSVVTVHNPKGMVGSDGLPMRFLAVAMTLATKTAAEVERFRRVSITLASSLTTHDSASLRVPVLGWH